MSGTMPPRANFGFIPVDDDGVTVGKIAANGQVKIGMSGLGRVILMDPSGARQMAKNFSTNVARANDLDWIGRALRECAREVERLTAEEIAAMCDLTTNMVQARGATKQ